jgi:ADP-heptose:LPS heptosyltransferase
MYLWYKKYFSFYFLLRSARFEHKKKFLLCWNRGLGDISLGLYGICIHIRKFIPDAEIYFLTRKDLAEAFQLLPRVYILVDKNWRRGLSIDIDRSLQQLHLKRKDFDIIIEKPDPTRWLIRDIGKTIPKLSWRPEWDELSSRFSLSSDCIGVHVNTETDAYYGYEKNWPISSWKDLFESIGQKGKRIILFGLQTSGQFADSGCIDLCGQTTIFEAISIIKNHCSLLIAPDSGILSLMYYLDCDFPLRIISLWADAGQGILRQRVPSPNPYLKHIPLIAPKKRLANITVSHIEEVLFS